MGPALFKRLRPRFIFLVLAASLIAYLFLIPPDRIPSREVTFPPFVKDRLPGGSRLDAKIPESLSLREEQCRAAFPGLMKEIDRAIGAGPFKLAPNDGIGIGPLQGRIKNGKLEILHAPQKSELSSDMRERQTAALHQLYKALVTSPTPLPDTAFSLSVQDTPHSHSWGYARPASSSKAKALRVFPMPHFSFWAWRLPFVGSIPDAAAAVSAIEASLPFAEKDPRALWRGTAWFNNGAGANPRLRQDLLRVAKNASWADVEGLKRGASGEVAANAVRIEDFCRHKYIIYTEGVGYSGRLQFHQLCASVILSPPIDWVQHTTHLVRPVFSNLLSPTDEPLEPTDEAGRGHARRKKAFPSSGAREAWPMEYSADDANMVFVNPDWSDLEATILWLEKNPGVAEGIARRQRETFAGRGYLSPAAEACYWRGLIRGWSKVANTDGLGWEDKQGVSFEEFVLIDGH